MPDNLEDTQEYFEQIQSPNLRWSFTINHAHFDPIGIKGFVEGIDLSLCEEVRVVDNNGEYEIHRNPVRAMSILEKCSGSLNPVDSRGIT